MKDRPILFSAPMVRALLDGSKTQTRRVVKFRDHDSHAKDPMDGKPSDSPWLWQLGSDGRYHKMPCPYGQPGDQLWVRETYQQGGCDSDYWYRADFDPEQIAQCKRIGWNWKPSIFMTRDASRVTLEITGIRVERLQDISEADANAEGCPLPAEDQHWAQCRVWYQDLWNQINGPGSWDANPYVWAITFKRITP